MLTLINHKMFAAVAEIGAAAGVTSLWRLGMLSTGDGIALASLFLSAWGVTQALFKYKIEVRSPKGEVNGSNGNGLNGRYVQKELCSLIHTQIKDELVKLSDKMDSLTEFVMARSEHFQNLKTSR